MDAKKLEELRLHMQGPGLAHRIARYLGTRGRRNRQAAITHLAAWVQLLQQIGYPGDPAPDPLTARRIERRVLAADETLLPAPDPARSLTRDAVLNARRSRNPEQVVAAFLFGPATIPVGMARGPSERFTLPTSLATELAAIDAAILGHAAVEVSWALRLGVMLNAEHSLAEIHQRLQEPDEDDDPEQALRYAHADVVPIVSALHTAHVVDASVPTSLVYLMLVHIIDTWITHEAEVFTTGGDLDATVEQTQRAMEEREASLRWLTRIDEWVTRLPELDDEPPPDVT